MADQDFALPLGHNTTEISTIEIQIGKSYLQPVAIQNYDDNYVEGLELQVPYQDSYNEAKRLYVCFNGTVRWRMITLDLSLPIPSKYQFRN